MEAQILFNKLGTLDRRYIFTAVFLAVLIPLLVYQGEEVSVSPPVQGAYDSVEALKPGQVIMISIDYDATSMPELQPMLEAILAHAFRRNLRVLMTGHIAIGLPLGQMALEALAQEYHKTYGIDYVNIGYRPGGIAVIVNIGREIRDMFSSDFRGTPLDQIPMMKDIHNYDNIGLLVTLTHGNLIDWWVQYGQARYGVKTMAGTTAVSAPDAYVYLNSHQLSGLIGGLRGAAEYETLIKRFGVGIRGMPAQTISHFLIIGFMIIGNAMYFLTKKKKG